MRLNSTSSYFAAPVVGLHHVGRWDAVVHEMSPPRPLRAAQMLRGAVCTFRPKFVFARQSVIVSLVHERSFKRSCRQACFGCLQRSCA